MKQQDPFRFWKIQPDGERAFIAYEHIRGYCQAALVQYQRAYELWRASSDLGSGGDNPELSEEKKQAMRQVVRDIHFLLISLQAVWKSLQRMTNSALFPNFCGPFETLRERWEDYFEQYREPRNTFEHYDDQIFGPDTRKNSPGYGVSLRPDGTFALGFHHRVFVNSESQEKLTEFIREFENAITSVVGPRA
jgi:hypothetical protein